jgi:iron complex outermembrane receptor protein
MDSKPNRTKVFHFKHWTRRSYAVFASLGKIIKISVLSISLTLLAMPKKSEAQTKTTAEPDSVKQLEEVEVTGEQPVMVYNSLNRIVTVITPAQISSQPVSSIGDVLENIALIDLRQRGPNDVQADISIRGGNYSQTLILLNGININNPQTGHHNLDLPITLSQIERIEIISGPASRIYGSDAFSGAINIITKSKIDGVEAEVSAGDFGLFNITASAGINHKNSRQYISVNTQGSGGYIPNTDYNKTSAFYSVSNQLGKAHLSTQAAVAVKNFGAQDFYTPRFPNQFEAVKSGFISTKLTTTGKISTSTSAYFRAHTDRFELFRNNENAPSWYKNHNYHFSKTAGVNLRASTSEKHGKTTAGINLRYEDINSNVLGIATGDTITALFDKNGFYTKFDSRLTTSFFAEQLIFWKKFSFTAGLMANHFQGDSVFLRLFPGIDLSYRLTKKIKLTANLNTSLRRPSFTDLYYSGPSNTGNPNLLPESNLSAEAGILYKSKAVAGNLTIFVSKGKNIIDWARKADTLKWQPLNISNSITTGYELSTIVFPKKFCNHKLMPKTIKLSIAQTKTDHSSGEYLSRYVDDYLKLHLTLGMVHSLTESLSLSWTFGYYDRNGTFQDYNPTTGKETTTPYGTHYIFDAKLSWINKKLSLWAQALNIFNEEYYDYGNVEAPGRWFTMGIGYRFSK